MLREHFNRVATNTPPPIHALMGERLLERVDGLRLAPRTILDLGAGVGAQSLALHRAFPDARVIALDHSAGMLERAKKHRGWWRRRFEVVLGDIAQPPIQPGSVDLVFANACLVYADEPSDWIRTIRTLLSPGGFVLLSTFGPDTLARERGELNASSSSLMDVQKLGSTLTQAGFNEPVLDTDWLTVQYADPQKLRADLNEMGWLHHPVMGLDAHTDFDQLNGGDRRALEVTFECVYASAFAPDAGQTLTDDHGAVASVPLSQIGVRKRD